jgi:hypothetical protein
LIAQQNAKTIRDTVTDLLPVIRRQMATTGALLLPEPLFLFSHDDLSEHR